MSDPKIILLVVDDDFDARLFKRVVQELQVANPLDHLSDGEDALEYLKRPNAAMPCVIFLDLNMRGMDGIEFMERIRDMAELKDIPIVVVTISNGPQERQLCRRLGAVGYVVKCLDYEEFKQKIQAFDQYWLAEKGAVETATVDTSAR